MALFLCVASVQAAAVNDTDNIIGQESQESVIKADVSDEALSAAVDEPVITATEDANKVGKVIKSDENNKVSKVISSSDGKVSAARTKTLSDLAEQIGNTKSNGVLKISGKYKYNPKTDKALRDGIFIHKNIKIVGKKCSIDGAGKSRIFFINVNKKVTLIGITIKNGYRSWANGGAILITSQSKLVIKKCVFKNNKVYQANGGAIAGNDRSILVSSHSKFYNNKAIRKSSKKWPADERGMGGAIEMNPGSKLTLYKTVFKKNYGYLSTILLMSKAGNSKKTSSTYVKKCLFERNTAVVNGVFYLDEYGKGKFVSTVFKNNVAKKDGGTLILDASKSAVLKNCRFIGNKGYVGAAIDLFKYNGRVSHVSLIGCKFVKNVAKESGGAIYGDLGYLRITKCKFTANRAGNSGGAIWSSGVITLKGDTFSKNKAKWGGSILLKNRNYIYMTKTRFSGNIATGNGPNIFALNNSYKVLKVKIIKK